MNQCEQYCRTIKRMANAGGEPENVLTLPLNGDASDISGNNHTPNIVGTPTYVTGYFTGTVALNAVYGSYVYYNMLKEIPDNYSLDFFVRYPRVREIQWGKYWYHPAAAQYPTDSGIGINQSTPADLSGIKPVVTTPTINLNTWYHIAITREGGVTRFFMDGVLKNTFDSLTVTDAGSQLYLGYSPFNERNTYFSNVKLTTSVRHVVTDNIFTFPVPTELYTE